MAKLCEEEGWQEEGVHKPLSAASFSATASSNLILTLLCGGEDMFYVVTGLLPESISYLLLLPAGC